MASGCSNSSLKLEVRESTPTQFQTAYPAFIGENVPEGGMLLGYPSPIATLSSDAIENLVVEDPIYPDMNFGSVSGLILNGTTNTLMYDTDIFLFQTSEVENYKLPPFLIGWNPKNGDVSGKTQENGQFEFNNVIPGKYYLITSTDLSPIYKSPAEAQPLLIEVEANRINNLGKVFYMSR